MVNLTIDDKPIVAEKGSTILQVAKENNIIIPTLCYHSALKPYTSCQLCTVQVITKGRSRLVTSCNYPIEEGIEVRTHSEEVMKIRKIVVELLLARCPNMKMIQTLAEDFGVEKTRFRTKEEKCILCGLCVRFCEEIVNASVVNFTGRGNRRAVAILPETSAGLCIRCATCASVCPAGLRPYIDAELRK